MAPGICVSMTSVTKASVVANSRHTDGGEALRRRPGLGRRIFQQSAHGNWARGSPSLASTGVDGRRRRLWLKWVTTVGKLLGQVEYNYFNFSHYLHLPRLPGLKVTFSEMYSKNG
jgi:hypothetical protein